MAPDGLLPLQKLRQGADRQLGCGAFLHEVSLEDLRRLTPKPALSWQQESWQRQRELIDRLGPANRYAVVWVEIG